MLLPFQIPPEGVLDYVSEILTTVNKSKQRAEMYRLMIERAAAPLCGALRSLLLGNTNSVRDEYLPRDKALEEVTIWAKAQVDRNHLSNN